MPQMPPGDRASLRLGVHHKSDFSLSAFVHGAAGRVSYWHWSRLSVPAEDRFMYVRNLGGERSFWLVGSIVTSLTWLDARDPKADVKIGPRVALDIGECPRGYGPDH